MKYIILFFIVATVNSCKSSFANCYYTHFENVENTYRLRFDNTDTTFVYESDGPMLGQTLSGNFKYESGRVELYPSGGKVEKIKEFDENKGVVIEIYGEDFPNSPLPMVHLIVENMGIDTLVPNGKVDFPTPIKGTLEMVGYSDYMFDISSHGEWRIYMSPEIGNSQLLNWRLKGKGIINKDGLFLLPCE